MIGATSSPLRKSAMEISNKRTADYAFNNVSVIKRSNTELLSAMVAADPGWRRKAREPKKAKPLAFGAYCSHYWTTQRTFAGPTRMATNNV
jgi:hypothetical protein